MYVYQATFVLCTLNHQIHSLNWLKYLALPSRLSPTLALAKRFGFGQQLHKIKVTI